jgi:protease IV
MIPFPPRQRDTFKVALRTYAAIAMVTLITVSGCVQRPLQMELQGEVTARTPPDNTASRLIRRTLPYSQTGGPAVAIIEVDGLLVNRSLSGFGSHGENPVGLFREKLNAASMDPEIQALVLRINSPGGGVTATDVMRRDLEAFRQCRDIPVIACLMDVGTAGAYYVATEADVIVAHPTSVTGGIGVILNVYNLEDTLGQFNVVPLPVKAGDKIDMPSLLRPMDPAEREILEQIADEFHGRFRDQVVQSRPLLKTEEEDFDGRVFSASQARERGLIDQIGYLDDAIAMARQAAGLPAAGRVVMFRRSNDRAFTAYDTTPNVPLQNSLLPLNIPGLDRSTLPTFLYLWQPDPSYVTTVGGR